MDWLGSFGGWSGLLPGARDEFVPFAFEVGGALGREAEELIGEAVRVAEYNRKGPGGRG